MTRQWRNATPPWRNATPPRRGRRAALLHGLGAATLLTAGVIGLPWLLAVVTGSPIPGRLPSFDEVVTALFRRADSTLLLVIVKYVAWISWAGWTVVVFTEAAAQIVGVAVPRIPGLAGLQRSAAILVGGLSVAVIGATAPISRAIAPPPADPSTAAPATLPVMPAPHAGANAYGTAGQAIKDTASAPERIPGPHTQQAMEVQPLQDRQIVVQFAFGTAHLSRSAQDAVTQAARDIRDHGNPRHPITIVGHTDAVGPAPYNQQLSRRRADTVRQALSHTLPDQYRFQVSGRGETAPIAAERHPDGSDNPAGRTQNRRVEITYTVRTSADPPQAQPSPSHPTAPPRQTPQPPTTEPPSTPPPTPSSPNSGLHVPSTPATPSTPTAPPSPDNHPTAPISVRLPTGALVGLSLAAAISIAVAATRLHRRRRRTPHPDHLAVAESEPASAPAIRTLRKAHLDAYAAAGTPPPSDVELVDADVTVEAPAHLTVGVRDAEQVTVALSGLSVGLDGPGAIDVARAVATELLAGAHRSRIELVTPRRAAMTLFALAGDTLDQLADTVPGLVVTPDLDSALRHLETEIVHRARMMNDHDVPDVTALRAVDPAEHLPVIVLIAAPGDAERSTRPLHATLQLAGRYGIGGVLLGPWPAGTTCRIDTDGRVLEAEGPQADTWADAQLFRLAPTDTTELLATIRSAHGVDKPAATQPSAKDAVPPQDSNEHPAKAPPTLQPPDLKDGQAPRPVHLRIFGPVSIETGDAKVTTGLRRISRDLLAFLALHPEGVTREEAIDAIWQDRDLGSGSTMFHTAVNNTRQTLRKATGLREPMFITYAAGRYQLDHNLFDVDLWQFLNALSVASKADNDSNRIPALRRLAQVYSGDLADDLTYEWAEGERERIRRTATDALVRLARMLEPDHPDDALPVLEQAFEHDPISEPLARNLMRLQARLGNLDSVRRTHQLLAHRLNTLDIDPSPETAQLLADLLRKRGRTSGR